MRQGLVGAQKFVPIIRNGEFVGAQNFVPLQLICS
jgi:hypothetical protein